MKKNGENFAKGKLTATTKNFDLWLSSHSPANVLFSVVFVNVTLIDVANAFIIADGICK